jgi:pyruvate dehydrogenase E2 component (dihydrolipoamide acetyltransferase)
MGVEFKLPDLGEGIHEAEVLAVKVKPGQDIREDEPLFEVETDKAVVEIPSPYTGKVEKVMVKTGDVITVGSVMVTFITGVGDKQSAPLVEKEEVAAVPAKATAPAAKKEATVSSDARANNAAPSTSEGPVPATPATRRLARELGFDLKQIPATGSGGRVLKEDVRAFAANSLEPMVSSALAFGKKESAKVEEPVSLSDKYGGKDVGSAVAEPTALSVNGPSPVALPDFAKYGPVERVLLRSIRRKTAEAMARSWAHIPHVTHCDEADLTNLEGARTKLEEELKKKGGRLTFTTFVLKAVASALKKYPQFNASLDEAKGEIVFKHYYNIGVAVATERGLIVPVIRDVDKKGIVELTLELNELAEKTRLGKIEVERLQGGTFTVTNVGAIGGTSMSPMINFPEAAILGMARAQQKPVVRNGEIAIGLIMPFALSFDHRIADGAEAAYFMRHIVSRLEEPYTFLLEA